MKNPGVFKEDAKSVVLSLTVSRGKNFETCDHIECIVSLSPNSLHIFSQDGETDFKTGVKNPERLLAQFDRCLQQLKRANKEPNFPSWSEIIVEELGENAKATIEQFTDSVDPFEMTITIEEHGGARFFMAICERQLEKLVQSFWGP